VSSALQATLGEYLAGVTLQNVSGVSVTIMTSRVPRVIQRLVSAHAHKAQRGGSVKRATTDFLALQRLEELVVWDLKNIFVLTIVIVMFI